MVRKLLKREFLYYAKSLFLFEGILLCIAVLNRLLLNIDSDNPLFVIVTSSLTMLAIFGCVACFIIAFVMIIVRFYKNLFSAEGYLMFTLPVTETQHLVAKLISAFVALLTAGITAIAYWLIILADQELFSEIAFELSLFFDYVSVEIGWHIILYIVEGILLVVLSLLSGILYYYTCIALGQATKIKNRILASVGIYFLLNIAGQFISPILVLVVGSVLSVPSVGIWIMNNPIATIHTFFIIVILLQFVISSAMFILIRAIMCHKLNLE